MNLDHMSGAGWRIAETFFEQPGKIKWIRILEIVGDLLDAGIWIFQQESLGTVQSVVLECPVRRSVKIFVADPGKGPGRTFETLAEAAAGKIAV